MHESGGPTLQRGTTNERRGRPTGAAAGGVAAALCLLTVFAVFAMACATGPPPAPAAAGFVEREVEAGMGLYAGGNYLLAADRLRAAAEEAERCDQPEAAVRIRVGECTAWLRGGNLAAFRRCTRRLEALQRQLGRSEPGINTLLALGAIARGEALPPYRLPASVRRLLQTTAAGGA